MNVINQFLGVPVVEALGWTILHSFWQGLVVAFLLTLALVMLRRQSAQARYFAGLGALSLLLASVVATFFWVYEAPLTGAWAPERFGAAERAPLETMAGAPSAGSGFWGDFYAFFEQQIPLIVALWLLGMLIFTLRMLGELAYIQHLKHYRVQAAAPRWKEKLFAIAEQMGVYQQIDIRESFQVSTPLVIGYIKPVILLPVGLLAHLTPAQVENVLAHELAHIRRHDYLVNILQSLVESVLFFNPAVWWISNLVRTEREHCCDDAAIDYTQDEVAYVETLAALEEWRAAPGSFAMAFNGRRGGVLGRVQRLLNGDRLSALSLKILWSTAILVLCLAASVVHLSSQTGLEGARLEFSDAPATDPFPEIAPEPLQEQESTPFPVPEAETGLERSLFTAADSLPPDAAAAREKIRQLQQEYHTKARQLKEKMLALQKQAMQLQREAVQMNGGKRQEALQAQQQLYVLQSQIEMKNHERELQQNQLQVEMLALESQMNALELEFDRADEIENEERREAERQKLQARERELERQAHTQEKRMQETELAMQREALEIRKQAQALERQLEAKEAEREMAINRVENKVSELEQQMNELDAQLDLLRNEFELQIREQEMLLDSARENPFERQE